MADKKYHKLLERQIKKIKRVSDDDEFNYTKLLELISQAYEDQDNSRRMNERSMQLMSDEVSALNERVLEEANAAVQDAEKRADLALKATNDGLWDWKCETGEIFCNTRWFQMFGMDVTQNLVLMKDFEKMLHPDEAADVNSTLIRHLKGMTSKFEYEHRLKDCFGNWVWVLARGRVVQRDENGHAIRMVGTHTDISEKKTFEIDLKEATKKAELANRAKSEFLANMSHEIRTPMNGIIGMTNLLLDTDLNSKQMSYTDAISRSADNLLELINDILDFSKIEAGHLELEKIDFDLRGAIEDVAEITSVRAREKNIDLMINYPSDLPTNVRGDNGRIKQVLNNLVGNAIKFTENGHIVIAIEKVSEKDKDIEFKISVTDTGIGIAPDRVDKIFEKFTQADTSTTRKYGGTGLGLTISKQLSELMEGSIGAESELGEGSTFWFTIKLEKSDQASDEVNLSSKDIENLKIICVDDNSIQREILTEQFRSWKLEVECYDRSQKAYDAMVAAKKAGKPFNMAILDYFMPETDGVRLGKMIKNDKTLKDTVLIMLSACSEQSVISDSEELGFAAYLTKPARASQLLDAIVTCWNNRDNQKEMIDAGTLSLSARKKKKKANKGDLKAKILLVEDNSVNQAVATAILEKIGCIVTVAANGQEAVDLIKEMPKDNSFDLILMDCQMPVMDGFEATAIIKDMVRKNTINDVPIVALTANAMRGDKEKCLSAGMDDYLSKPIKERHIIKMVEGYSNKKASKKVSKKNDKKTNSKANGKVTNGNANKTQEETSMNDNILDVEVYNSLKELMGDSMNMIVDQYIEQGQIYIDKINASLISGDPSLLRDAAHPLKSSSNQVGAVELGKLCATIEDGAKEGKTKELESEIKLSGELFEKSCTLLKEQASS